MAFYHIRKPKNPNFSGDIAIERLKHKKVMLYNDKDNHWGYLIALNRYILTLFLKWKQIWLRNPQGFI